MGSYGIVAILSVNWILVLAFTDSGTKKVATYSVILHHFSGRNMTSWPWQCMFFPPIASISINWRSWTPFHNWFHASSWQTIGVRGGVQLRTYCANCVLVHRCTHIRLYGDVHSKSQHLEVFQETVCDRQGPPIRVGEYSRRVLSTPCSFTNLKKKGISHLGAFTDT